MKKKKPIKKETSNRATYTINIKEASLWASK